MQFGKLITFWKNIRAKLEKQKEALELELEGYERQILDINNVKVKFASEERILQLQIEIRSKNLTVLEKVQINQFSSSFGSFNNIIKDRKSVAILHGFLKDLSVQEEPMAKLKKQADELIKNISTRYSQLKDQNLATLKPADLKWFEDRIKYLKSQVQIFVRVYRINISHHQ